MADYYQQFSEVFEFKTKKQTDLCLKLLELLSDLYTDEDIRESEGTDEEHELLGFMKSLPKDTQDALVSVAESGALEYKPEGEQGVWVYSEECGNLEALGLILREVLYRTKDNDTVFTLTWADTCSKPRTSAFGGGYMVVSAEGEEWGTAHTLADGVAKQMKGKVKGPEAALREVKEYCEVIDFDKPMQGQEALDRIFAGAILDIIKRHE